VVRADSGFAREALMAWCEEHEVDFVLGLARNARLELALEPAFEKAEELLSLIALMEPPMIGIMVPLGSAWSRSRTGGLSALRHLGCKGGGGGVVVCLP
jgi:hypothetical protein